MAVLREWVSVGHHQETLACKHGVLLSAWRSLSLHVDLVQQHSGRYSLTHCLASSLLPYLQQISGGWAHASRYAGSRVKLDIRGLW